MEEDQVLASLAVEDTTQLLLEEFGTECLSQSETEEARSIAELLASSLLPWCNIQ